MPKVRQTLDIHNNVMDKQAEVQKKSVVYSTERINKIIEDIQNGGKPDTIPFFHGEQLYRDSGIIFEYTDEELEELDKCSVDANYFIETYCKFLNKNGRTLVQLREYQKRLIRAMSAESWSEEEDTIVPEHPHCILLQSRQTGKTTTTAAYITWYICFHEDRNVFICANKGRTATEIMGKVKEVIEGLPYFLKPGIINLSESRMKFENGCTIKCAAASKSPATGDSIQLLYIDEAALIPGNVIEEYWASVIPTMSSFPNSQIIISSTPRGKQNRFFKIVDGAIKKENDFFFQRVDWWEVPGRDEKWAQKQRDLLGDELFEREFNLSFDTNAARLISDTTIKEMEKNKKEFVTCEFYNIPVEISKNIIWHPDFRPDELTYYDLKNRRFLLVIDTAQGIEAGAVGKKDSDYNIINIFEIVPLDPEQIEKNRNNNPITIKDCVQYKQVGIYMDNFKDESVCAEAAKFISFHILKTGFQDIDNTRILVEMNFNGNNWLNKFKQHPSYYEAVMLKTPHGINQAQNGPVKLMVGFKTTSGARGKNYYCELGAKMMHQNQIIISQNNDNDINKSSIGQLTAFEKVEGKYMGICCHDDISVTCLFVPIAFDAPSYILWLQEWLEGDALNLYNETAQIILHMLEIYIDKEVEMDDETYNAFYNAVGKSFGKLTHPQKGYSSLLNQENSSSYNVGFGNMISSRR